MQFKLEELGSLATTLERDRKLFAEANWTTLRARGDGIKNAVRADIRASGIKGAAKVANAWRGKMYPGNAGKHAKAPAYIVGSQAEKIVETFEDGPTIHFQGGTGLIPIGKARRIKLRPGQPRTDLPAEALKLYGASKFSMHRMRTGELALGVFSVLETGKSKFIPLFLMRKSVQAPKLLKGKKIIEQKAAEAAQRQPDEAFALFEQRREQATQGSSGAYRTTVVAGR